MNDTNKKKQEEVHHKFILLFRMMNRRYLAKLSSIKAFKDTTRGQGKILQILKMKPEISQKELNELLDISKQSLAESLSKLEKNGYIVRESSEEDKRVLVVKLTRKGIEANIGLSNAEKEMSEIFDDFTEEEMNVLCAYLDRIISHFENEDTQYDEFIEKRKAFDKFVKEHKKEIEQVKKLRSELGDSPECK